MPSFSLTDLEDRVQEDPSLHLGVSLRSFRSERLSEAVHLLLGGEVERARALVGELLESYPIRITRNLDAAKSWVRSRARGSERYGLLASAGARRLKPLGVYPSSVRGNECEWFLNGASDVRSSFYLEDAATEFEVQGLELDWSVVCWDGDLLRNGDGWDCRAFKGTKWQQIRSETDQQYKVNAYRVLLTRARQGMVIFVPEGDQGDPTRHPAHYDSVWEYLKDIGLPTLTQG